MDLLYILGSGTVWDNNEIRFSLRSAEKNIKDLEKVFIVGEKPDWLQNIEHLPLADLYKIKWRNAYAKVSRACMSPFLSADFLLMNDDFFILKPITGADYPFYFSSILTKNASYYKTKFLTTPQQTATLLPLHVKDVRNFAVHRPVRFNKQKYLDMPRFDLAMTGFSPRSFYCNFYGVPGVQCADKTLSPLMTEKDFDRACADRTDISVFSATARSPIFQNWIQKMFPEPSKYEKKA